MTRKAGELAACADAIPWPGSRSVRSELYSGRYLAGLSLARMALAWAAAGLAG